LAACTRAIQTHTEADFFACRILDFGDPGRLYSAGDCFLRAGVGYRRGQEQWDREEFHQECEIFSASGCAALYRKSALEMTGGFDERFFAYLEDVDLGLRLQSAGCRGCVVFQ
jgi:GT2 family glycosyltransferase